MQFSEFFCCYLDCFESVVTEVKSYELELGGECLLGEEVGGEGVVGQVQQQQALQALHATRSVLTFIFFNLKRRLLNAGEREKECFCKKCRRANET